MDLLQLRYFYDSANYLSISKTAEKYNVPATSVSASIRRLESELGCKLFDRQPNRIMLNSKGQLMRNSLSRIFDEMDQMLQHVSDRTDDHTEIKILARSLRMKITERIIQYSDQHPQTRFRLVTGFDETDLDRYTIILDAKSDAYAGYEELILGKQRTLFYVSANSPLCGRRLRLAQLAEMPFVVTTGHERYGKAFNASCKEAGFLPNIVAQVNDSHCFRKIVSSGIAIGLIAGLVNSPEDGVQLVPLDVTDYQHAFTICLYYKKENNFGNIARFISFVKENIPTTDDGFII